MRNARLLLWLCVLATGACGDSTAPSPPLINITGTWVGMIGEPRSMNGLRMTWAAAQNGNTVSGIASVVKPVDNIPAAGILSGTMSINQMSLRFTVPSGSVQGFPSCSVSGAGSAVATDQTISGTLTLAFASCAGTGLQATGSDQLTLTRQ